MKNLDLPYYFTGIEPFYPPISPYLEFLKAHLVHLEHEMELQGSELDKIKLLQKALDEEYPIYYDITSQDEDFYASRFRFPIA